MGAGSGIELVVRAGLEDEAPCWGGRSLSCATSDSRSWILTRKLSTSCFVAGRRASPSKLQEHYV